MDTSLKSIGVKVQLGHPDTNFCEYPREGPANFTVLDASGIHSVHVRFCGCVSSDIIGDDVQQLMRAEWYPATISNPQTCFTFGLLRLWTILSAESKLSAHHFYATLRRVTDNTNTENLVVRAHDYA